MRRILYIFVLLHSTNTLAETYSCFSVSGNSLFKNFKTFQISHSGNSVKLLAKDKTAVNEKDFWLFTVVAENKQLGFRAYRTPSKSANSAFDVAIGGELILINEEKIKAVASLSNAASLGHGQMILNCK